MTLGEQIKMKREEMKLSQEELAERVGVSRQAVSKWESNRSVPTGANRRALCQALSLEWPASAARKPPKGGRLLCAAGWGAAAILLVCLVCGLPRFRKASQPDAGVAGPALLCIHFYDAMQEEVLPEALWYNTAAIESILLQWTGGTPQAVQMLFTPSGTETAEQTELLGVKAPPDGESALLLCGASLHRDGLTGHLDFALYFGGGQVVTTDSPYNVLYDPDALAPRS